MVEFIAVKISQPRATEGEAAMKTRPKTIIYLMNNCGRARDAAGFNRSIWMVR